jgi:molecular chaperone GrpE (heat shock protein)
MREDLNLQLPLDRNEPPSSQPAPPSESPTAAETSADSALSDWKVALRRDFERWLESVDAIPVAAEPPAEAEPPDLFSFYEQLAALGAESRRANRKTAEVFSQWAESLGKFDAELARLREQLSESGREDDRLAREHCLLLVELLDRLRRVQAAFANPPPRQLWSRDALWRKAWETHRQAFDIIVEHLEAWLEQQGVTRIESVEAAFDPQTMVAVATVPDPRHPHQTVVEELAAGYLRDGELLRPAQVKISLNQERETL